MADRPINRGSLGRERKTVPYKIVVLGDGGVGKSALTMQFVASTFVDTHDPTIEDAYRQQCIVDGEIAHLDILDTAGQREFTGTAMREQYMRSGEGFLLCYSITDRRSYQEIQEYKRLINRVRCQENIPLVLVANKTDLESQRQVSTAEGKSLAQLYGCPFVETSAARRQCVDDMFHEIIREIRNLECKELHQKQQRKSGFKDFLRKLTGTKKRQSKKL